MFVGRADFDFFVRFENIGDNINARWHDDGSSQLCPLAELSRSDRRVLALLLVRVNCSLLCCAVRCSAVLAVR